MDAGCVAAVRGNKPPAFDSGNIARSPSFTQLVHSTWGRFIHLVGVAQYVRQFRSLHFIAGELVMDAAKVVAMVVIDGGIFDEVVNSGRVSQVEVKGKLIIQRRKLKRRRILSFPIMY